MEQPDQSTLIIPDSLKRNAGWLIVVGIVFLILGLIGLGMTISLTIASVLLFGFLLFIAAASQLVEVFTCHSLKGALWHALIAALYIIAGSVMMFDPLLASTILTAVIASLLIMIGVFRITMAFTIRQTAGWGWIFVAGLISMILGTLIMAQWPWSGLWVIGLFIAIELVMNGMSCLMLAYAIKKTSANK